MKIRADFVTNSSSSSYVTVTIKTKSKTIKTKEDEANFDGDGFEVFKSIDDMLTYIALGFDNDETGYGEYIKQKLANKLKGISFDELEKLTIVEHQTAYGNCEEESKLYSIYDFKNQDWDWHSDDTDEGDSNSCEDVRSAVDIFPLIAPIEGTGYEGRNDRIENVCVGDKLIFKADYNNKYYSPVAIEIFNSNNETLGYICDNYDYNVGAPILPTIAEHKDELIATVESVTPLSKRSARAKYALMDVKFSLATDIQDETVNISNYDESEEDELEYIQNKSDAFNNNHDGYAIYYLLVTSVNNLSELLDDEDFAESMMETLTSDEVLETLGVDIDILYALETANVIDNNGDEESVNFDTRLLLLYEAIKMDDKSKLVNLIKNVAINNKCHRDSFALLCQHVSIMLGVSDYIGDDFYEDNFGDLPFNFTVDESEYENIHSELLTEVMNDLNMVNDKNSSPFEIISKAKDKLKNFDKEDVPEHILKDLEKTTTQLDEAENEAERFQSAMEKNNADVSRRAEELAEEQKSRQQKRADKKYAIETIMFAIYISEMLFDFPTKNKKEFSENYGGEFSKKMTQKALFELKNDLFEKFATDKVFYDTHSQLIKEWDFEDRYDLLADTIYQNRLDDNGDKACDFALDKSKEWFSDDELQIVKQRLQKNNREIIDSIISQLVSIEPAWKEFSTAKSYLQLSIHDETDELVRSAEESYFTEDYEGAIFTVKLLSGNYIEINLLNILPWVWNVSVMDIWEAAYEEEIRNYSSSYFEDFVDDVMDDLYIRFGDGNPRRMLKRKSLLETASSDEKSALPNVKEMLKYGKKLVKLIDDFRDQANPEYALLSWDTLQECRDLGSNVVYMFDDKDDEELMKYIKKNSTSEIKSNLATLKEMYDTTYNFCSQYMNGSSSNNYSSSSSGSNTTTSTSNSNNSSSGCCYVATCAYGSYDCPEVWTLRRFRDYVLAKTWYGRLFITLYYFFAPYLVKFFGDTEWFKIAWRKYLDKKVEKLNNEGFENTPYNDINWK